MAPKRPGRKARAWRKLLKQYPGKNEAFKIFNMRYEQERASCKAYNFRRWVKAAEEVMDPIICFFVGDMDKYKRKYHKIWADPQKYANSKYRLPWPLQAYKGIKDHSEVDASKKLKNITTWTQTLKMTEKCRRCKKKKCRIKIPFGIAMKLAVGAFDTVSWNEYCDQETEKTKFDYSHLHGLNYCCNPLNGDWDMRWVNLGPRKDCHAKAFTTGDDLCKMHPRAPCYLKGTRMVRNVHKIARKMMRLNEKSRPAIEAYDRYEYG